MPRRFQKKLVLIITCLALASVHGFHDYCSAQPRKSANAHAPTGSVKVLIERGKSELERKRYAAAVRLFSTAIRRNPASAEAYRLRGTAQDRMGLPQKAVHDFTKYIELKPRDPAGYIGRADARNFNSEHTAALEDYNTAAKFGAILSGSVFRAWAGLRGSAKIRRSHKRIPVGAQIESQ